MTQDQLLRRPAVEAMVGLRRSAIYERVAEGSFPAPLKIGRRAVAWRRSEVEAWLESRPRTREGAEA